MKFDKVYACRAMGSMEGEREYGQASIVCPYCGEAGLCHMVDFIETPLSAVYECRSCVTKWGFRFKRHTADRSGFLPNEGLVEYEVDA